MNVLFEHPEKLPNGQLLNHGDVVKCRVSHWVCIEKVYENEGNLFVKHGPGPYCFEISISHLVNSGVTVDKVTPVDVYKFCKETGFAKPEKFLTLFKS